MTFAIGTAVAKLGICSPPAAGVFEATCVGAAPVGAGAAPPAAADVALFAVAAAPGCVALAVFGAGGGSGAGISACVRNHAITSNRSSGFGNPPKLILVPGMNTCGCLRNWNRSA